MNEVLMFKRFFLFVLIILAANCDAMLASISKHGGMNFTSGMMCRGFAKAVIANKNDNIAKQKNNNLTIKAQKPVPFSQNQKKNYYCWENVKSGLWTGTKYFSCGCTFALGIYFTNKYILL